MHVLLPRPVSIFYALNGRFTSVWTASYCMVWKWQRIFGCYWLYTEFRNSGIRTAHAKQALLCTICTPSIIIAGTLKDKLLGTSIGMALHEMMIAIVGYSSWHLRIDHLTLVIGTKFHPNATLTFY